MLERIPLLRPLRLLATNALVVLGVLLAVVAGRAATVTERADFGGLTPAFEVLGDGKAIRNQQQVAVREPARAARLGSSTGSKSVFAELRPRLHVGASPGPTCTAGNCGLSAYLQQRTRCPREPPPQLA
jgi:hypothetical protein